MIPPETDDDMNSLQNGLYISIVLLLFVTSATLGCMRPIPYNPEQVEYFHSRAENVSLEFETERGRQVAFYIPPDNAPDLPPSRLNILYPGINSVALGWQQYIRSDRDPDAGYLLIDYPGRGLSEGSMRPETNYLNTEGALKVLRERFRGEEFKAEMNLLGHSFGTGAALQFAERAQVSRVVLVAPFSDLKTAVALKSWFLSIIMPSQIDNRELIQTLLQTGHPPQISILHGTLDQTLPVTMSRELVAIDPERIVFHEFATDGHSDIITNRRDLIFGILNGRGH